MKIRPVIWVPILVVVLSGIIGWGAWATVLVTSATPEVKFEAHEKENNEKFSEIQTTLYEKLDDIHKTILDLYKGD